MELQLPTWQRSKDSLLYYNRRSPEDSPLYRVLYHYREEFEYRYEELFQQKYGFLRAEVLDAFDAYLNCGILRHGCALACCESCSHSELIAFSCKKRVVCPSCDAKRSHIFAEHLHENILLQQPHKHAVFTIPIRLRAYYKYDRTLFTELYQAAWQTWSEYLSSVLPGRTAAVMSLHSAGDLLNWHPHIHSLVLTGTVEGEEKFHPIKNIDTELLEEIFADKVFQFLLEKKLISKDVIDNMKSWSHSGFRIWLGEDISKRNEEQRLFISRYLAKCPLSLSRIQIIDNPLAPTIRYYKDDDKTKYIDRTPLQFLAELSIHIPKTHERISRLFGLYSYRTRGAKKRDDKFRALLKNNFEPLKPPLPESKPPSKYWATWIKKVYEVNPLLCKRCGAEMKIKSFIHDYRKIKKLTEKLDLQDWRAPPAFKSKFSYVDTSSEFNQE